MGSEENSECQSQNVEDGDKESSHAIDERKLPEPLFLLNVDKGPELDGVAETSIVLESHIVIIENDDLEVECFLNGDSKMEAWFDGNVNKELD